MLLSPEGEKVCSIVGVTGAGGIGKSALAYRFANIHRAKFPDGVIGLRVDEKDVNTIARRLAKAIDKPIAEDDDMEAGEIMQTLFAPRRMLLIFDNAEEAKIKVLRPGGNRCAVIVTTRNQNLPVSFGVPETATVRLRSLPEKDALDLLRKILGKTQIDGALAVAKKIAGVVGRLPLALQVIGGTLRGKRRSLASYADSLEKQKEQLKLLKKLRLGEDPDFNVEACLNLSLELLKEEEIDFFACLGVCAEDGFAQRTAMAAAGCEDEFEAENFLDKLHDRSLLNYAENQEDRFVFHPLVREYARSLAQDRNLLNVAQERHAQFFMERLESDDLEDETVVAEVATDLSDIFLAAKWLQNERGETTESRKEAYEFVLKLEPLFEQYGYWEEGITLMERLETWAEQSQDWYAIARCKMHQARYWSFVEEFERAEEILISARDISSDEQKIEDIDTRKERHAKILTVLGGVYQKQGETEKAIETFREVIAQETETGNKRSLAIAYNRLGNLLESQNKLEEAQQAFEEGIAIAESIDDKLAAAIGWNCLGGLLEKQGKLEEAQHAFENKIKNTDLDDKQSLAITWNRLGGLLEKQGKLEEAQHAFEEVIAIAESIDDKRKLAISWNRLGGLLEKQGKLKEAQHAFEEVIVINKSINDKHQLAIGWNCLVGVLEKQGELKKGKEAFENLLSLYQLYEKDAEQIDQGTGDKQLLGVIYNRLGNLLESQNNLEEAQQAFEKRIAIAESIDDQHGLIISLNCLGGLLEKQGKLEEAQHAFEKVIVVTKSIDDKLQLAIAWNRLGGVLEKQGKLKEAQNAYQEGIVIAESIDNKHQLAIAWNCLGGLLEKQGNLKEAQQAFEKTIKYTNFDDKKSLAIGWNSLGRVLQKQGKLMDTEQAFQEVMAIAENIDDKLTAAFGLHKLGRIYKSKRELETAEKFLKESIEIFKDKDYLPGLTKVMNTLGSVLEKQQKWQEAKKVLEESYSFAEELGDELGKAIIANSLGQVIAHLEVDEAFERSLMYFNQSIKLGKKLNNERHLAKVYTARGKVFLKREFYDRAIEELSQGFEIDVKLGNIRGLRIITSDITYVLYTLGRPKEALAYCERVLEIAPNNSSFLKLYDRIQRAIATGIQPTFIKTGWVRYIRYNKKERLRWGRITPDDRSLDITFNEKYIGTESVSELTRGSLVEVEVEKKHGKLYAKQISLIEDEDDDDFW